MHFSQIIMFINIGMFCLSVVALAIEAGSRGTRENEMGAITIAIFLNVVLMFLNVAALIALG